MSVIDTDQWLKESYHDPVKICNKLISYFEDATPLEIYQYLLLHGMYKPQHNGEKMVVNMCDKKFWNITETEFKKLKTKWSGPEIPIFIFPSNMMNRDIVYIYNGKSGLAFHDKLFLFLSDENTEKEISALLTHEYNHVCRIKKLRKIEDKYTLLDTIVLEGLAESAVKEFHGEQCAAPWTNLYTREQAKKMWVKYIASNQNLNKSTKDHHDILYGTKIFYPKMCGYSTGFHIVQQCIEKSNLSSSELLSYSSEKILEISSF